MAVEKILLEFDADIKQLKSDMAEIKKQLGDVDKKVESSGSKMTNTFKNLGKAIAGAFTIREIVRFGQEAVRLAATMEGVERAFYRIGSPQVLADLREATRGTVSDLQLMQNAVKASNFQIPLEQLSRLFAFAQQRARETGESVDYLVDSIVLGIGRKSPLILDNLGISAVRLREEFKGLGIESAGVGDVAEVVANIIEEEMEKAGDSIATTADEMAAFNAQFQNWKTEVGKDLIPITGVLIDALEDVGTAAVFVQDKIFEFFAFLGSERAKQKLANDQQKEVFEDLMKEGLSIDQLKQKLKELTAQRVIQNKAMHEYRMANDTEEMNRLGKALNYNKDQMAAVNALIKQMNKSLTGSEDGGDGGGGGFNGAVLSATKATLDLSESVDKLPKLVDKVYDPFREATSLMDKFREAAEGIVDTNLDEFYLRLGIAISEADDANIEFFKSILDGQADEALNKQREIAAFYDIAGSSIQFFSTMSSQATERYLQDLQKQLDAGKITQEQFDRERKKALREQAKDTRALAVFDIVLNTARSVMSFLAQTPPNVPGSIAAGVAGALQLSTAITQPLPAFATGTVDLKGEGTETSDSIVARLSKGESVITAKGTKQDKALFEAANKLQLEDYINKNYVLPALVKVQKDKADMFDDYRLYMSLQNMKKSDKENTDKIVRAIKTEYTNNRRYWA